MGWSLLHIEPTLFRFHFKITVFYPPLYPPPKNPKPVRLSFQKCPSYVSVLMSFLSKNDIKIEAVKPLMVSGT